MCRARMDDAPMRDRLIVVAILAVWVAGLLSEWACWHFGHRLIRRMLAGGRADGEAP